jgi:acetyl esterase/lipase
MSIVRLAFALFALGLATPSFGANAALGAVGTYTIVEDDLVYARAAATELRAHTFRPKSDATLPAIIDVHGGAWTTGDRMSGALYDRGLATAGMFVFSIDFRQGPAQKHPAANQDIGAAVRYLRANATRLKIDPDSIGLVGSSSGGHLALLAGLEPNAAKYTGTQIATGNGFASADGDASVRYVVALWPVADPAYRYEYAKRVGRAELMRSHDGYFGTQVTMRSASVPRLLRAKEQTHVPPLLVVQPGNDANIPREMTFDLLAAYQEAGGRTAYQFYPNRPHAFGHRPSTDTDHLIVAMRDFIAGELSEVK